jgi:hypothetical protein
LRGFAKRGAASHRAGRRRPRGGKPRGVGDPARAAKRGQRTVSSCAASPSQRSSAYNDGEGEARGKQAMPRSRDGLATRTPINPSLSRFRMKHSTELYRRLDPPFATRSRLSRQAGGEPRRALRVVSPTKCSHSRVIAECVMRRKIGTVIATLLLLSGSSLMCSAQTGGSPSAGQKGLAGSPKAEGIGSTSSTHKPSGSSSSRTGMENRTSTGSEMGTNTSTHNPSGKKD